MKGISCEKPDRLARIECSEPAYVHGEAIVRIRRIGICGTDLHAMAACGSEFRFRLHIWFGPMD